MPVPVVSGCSGQWVLVSGRRFEGLEVGLVQLDPGHGVQPDQCPAIRRFLGRVENDGPDRPGLQAHESERGRRMPHGEGHQGRRRAERLLLADHQRPGGAVVQEGQHQEPRRDHPQPGCQTGQGPQHGEDGPHHIHETCRPATRRRGEPVRSQHSRVEIVGHAFCPGNLLRDADPVHQRSEIGT